MWSRFKKKNEFEKTTGLTDTTDIKITDEKKRVKEFKSNLELHCYKRLKEAEAKAFTDFQDITQSTQQSARPDMTSQQQASWIGKLVLNFLNTPSQYNRIIKKAGSDILNRRITPPNTSQTQSDMSNLSRILYYGAAGTYYVYTTKAYITAYIS